MNKAVLISIRPEWCANIASGEKTIEVRKTRPKLPTPFKCYIYMTKQKKGEDGWLAAVCAENSCYYGAGSVIGEFVCDEIYDWHCGYDSRYDTNCLVAMTCLDAGELYAYGQGKPLYGWHISELQIYDKPKELIEFKSWVKLFTWDFPEPITRPPQSFCYVEDVQ